MKESLALEPGDETQDIAAGPARGQEQPVGETTAMRVHESPRDLFGAEVGAPHLAAAEGRAVAAGQGAGVRLHDAHEPRRPLAGVTHLRDADRVARAHQRALRTIAVGGLRENGHSCPEVHPRQTTIHEMSTTATLRDARIVSGRALASHPA